MRKDRKVDPNYIGEERQMLQQAYDLQQEILAFRRMKAHFHRYLFRSCDLCRPDRPAALLGADARERCTGVLRLNRLGRHLKELLTFGMSWRRLREHDIRRAIISCHASRAKSANACESLLLRPGKIVTAGRKGLSAQEFVLWLDEYYQADLCSLSRTEQVSVVVAAQCQSKWCCNLRCSIESLHTVCPNLTLWQLRCFASWSCLKVASVGPSWDLLSGPSFSVCFGSVVTRIRPSLGTKETADPRSRTVFWPKKPRPASRFYWPCIISSTAAYCRHWGGREGQVYSPPKEVFGVSVHMRKHILDASRDSSVPNAWLLGTLPSDCQAPPENKR